MSIIAAASRQALRARAPAVRIARRNLGDSVTGPPITDFPANAQLAMSFFTKSPMSYGEFKQQCISLRLFAFMGVAGGCAISFFLNPPKSSYWMRYSPLYALSYVKNCFVGSAPPIFLTEKVEREVNVPAIAAELISTRRLLSAGSDSEEEH
eukprot:CAMPEP_0197632842 /NCGR_PEP_ID=MMETSP1338-20131121/9395_1 /TAXON_ID=43686 ORGANISM="Pelagodinium beii, Strain RCC1491" /NCGR_SAMPLE_ID=MMETSP1338 /ASSEMBLY_ACC=CAM_ASM_000754 /LENGTH=151 /DNA_ID=CAMNT_0043204413 /DNA_START=73 /DNA_END=528 /DNA_ORIENTATION=-